MDKKVVKFFEDSGCLMTYLLEPRKQPTKLLDAQVKAGAEAYYRKLQSGEVKARPNQYPSGVWYEAQRVKYSQFLRDNEILEHHKKIIEALNITITRLEDQKWKWCVLGLIIGGLAMWIYNNWSFLCQ